MCRVIATLAFILVVPSIVNGDSWSPWLDQIVVSANGNYYVVLKRCDGPEVFGEWGPVEYTMVQRGMDSPPITAVHSEVVSMGAEHWDDKRGQLYKIVSNEKVNVRDGDNILGTGKLDRAPLGVVVSDDGLGFACFDVYGYNYADYESKNALILIASNGAIKHKKSIGELFNHDELGDLDESAGGTLWTYPPDIGWFHSVENKIVLVSAKTKYHPKEQIHFVRMIDWKSGKITRSDSLKSDKSVKNLKRKHSRASR